MNTLFILFINVVIIFGLVSIFKASNYSTRRRLKAIKNGYYSDKYFNRTKEILHISNVDNKNVIMQVFARKEGVFCGELELKKIFKECVDNPNVINIASLKDGVIHNKVNASAGEGFNIMIERLHNNIRQRTKTFRGFHGSVDSANAIMKGLEIYYNFITKHQTLKRCPYELAIPELKEKLNNPNKWLSLIQLANTNN